MIAMQCIPNQLSLESESNAPTATCAETALACFSDCGAPEGIEILRISCGHAAADADLPWSFEPLFSERFML
jgi:hypothetical protein